MHDVVGYLNHIEDPNEVWESELMLYSYDLIFLLKPVSQIYVNDEDRMETF